jgi:hypothetical protein
MGVVAMNKVVLMLLTVFFLTASNTSAAKVTAVGEESYEVKDQATKMFIYDTMQVWLRHSLNDYYHNKYHADSISWGQLKPEGIHVWIKQHEPTETGRTYTHLIKISLEYDKLMINDKKEIKTKDTFTYAVNADLLSLCPESGKSEKELKLMNSTHTVRP